MLALVGVPGLTGEGHVAVRRVRVARVLPQELLIGQSRAHAAEAIWNAVTKGVASIWG